MAIPDDLDLGQTIRGFAANDKLFQRYTLHSILGRALILAKVTRTTTLRAEKVANDTAGFASRLEVDRSTGATLLKELRETRARNAASA